MTGKPAAERRTGLLNGFAAYGMWGLVPLFWPLLKPAGAVEILAHRMVWSLVFVAAALAVVRRWAWIGELVRQPRRLALITVAAAVITVNWGVYIWSVNSGHVVEASLGYFINPLVTIAMGVLLLKERLRPAQWAAVGIGALAVVVLTVGYGRPPWISLCLAFSFATYGLVKKKVNLGGIESLAAETAIQFLPALGYLVWLGAQGESTFGAEGAGHALLLAATGIVTALPLVCFGAAAIRVPLSTLGLLQYLAPVFQFLLGILYFKEAMPPERWAGFALVWLALTLLTWDALRTARRAARALSGRRADAGDTTVTPGAGGAVPAAAPATAPPSEAETAGAETAGALEAKP
ncbi:EamA family transporter RarD [Streptomyces pseudogriseolus]|uniref:EamA family transporter RarD n=1 Tax=Streptomyces pseudogriseolus TaxID=36817 RepID=UPI003FA211F5